MRLDCLTSAVLPSEFASRDVGAPLDCGCLFESDSCCGEDTGSLRGACFGATIGRGASPDEDCANAVLAQNRRATAIAAQPLRAKQKPWRRDRVRLMGLFETATRNVFGNKSL